MESLVKKISESLYDIELKPISVEEVRLLKDYSSDDHDTLQLYYNEAVSKNLGPDANLLAVLKYERWPNSATVKVQFSRGLAN